MSAECPDTQAVDARRRGIVDALYRKYSQVLRNFLARKRLSRDEVADIVQETYCRLHKSGNVETIRYPKAFLFRVANNVRLNLEKHRRYRIEDDAVDIEGLDAQAEEPGPYRRIKAEQEWAVVSAALEELPPTCRDAFVMNRFENLSYSQIAVELGLSVSMIEKHVSHAISHMRKRLSSAGPLSARKLLRVLKQTS